MNNQRYLSATSSFNHAQAAHPAEESHYPVASLVLADRPNESIQMLVYLKKLSELLFAWEQTSKSIMIQKVINKTYNQMKTLFKINSTQSLFDHYLLTSEKSLVQF